MMEKCKLCSKNAKSVYHYGKCPKEESLFELKIKHWDQLDRLTFPSLAGDGRLVTVRREDV